MHKFDNLRSRFNSGGRGKKKKIQISQHYNAYQFLRSSIQEFDIFVADAYDHFGHLWPCIYARANLIFFASPADWLIAKLVNDFHALCTLCSWPIRKGDIGSLGDKTIVPVNQPHCTET